MKLKLDHISLEVKDFTKANKFYKALVKAAGLKRLMGGKGWVGYGNREFQLFLGVPDKPRVKRAQPTGEEFVIMDHLAFTLGSRKEVDTLAAALIKAGFKPVFPAQEYPDFGPGFYAVTFCDPSNNVLEFNFRK